MLVGAAGKLAANVARHGRLIDGAHVGRHGLHLALRLAGTTAAVPLLTGFLAVAAAFLVGRSLLDVAQHTRSARSLRSRSRFGREAADDGGHGLTSAAASDRE